MAKASSRFTHRLIMRLPGPVVVLVIALGLLFLDGCFVKPNPITEEEHWTRAQDDKTRLFQDQAYPAGPITLQEAVARAVKYNLDHRLSQMEAAFHMKQLDVANLGMLPNLALNAGYSIRNNEAASSSISYQNRTETLEPSVSSPVNRVSGDLSFSWSLLDFGLSYFQARQQADRFLILQERRRRLMNNLVKDVISTYFRVATAQRVGPLVDDTLRKAEDALELYRKIEVTKSGPLAQTLEQQRTLLTIISHLRNVSLELAAARSRLAALMNLPLDRELLVVVPDIKDLPPPMLSAKLPDLEMLGIYMRPDLREEVYQSRIDKYEVKKEMLRLIPGLNAFSTGYYDSNQYLVNNFWAETGARTTVDLLGMAGKVQQVKSAKVQAEVGRTRRLAATIAAMVQINMGYYQYLQSVELYKDADRLNEIENKLLELSQASAKVKEVGILDNIRQSALTVNSRLERDRTLVEVFNAWGNLYFSIGGDVLGSLNGSEELAPLTDETKKALDRWLAGELPPLPADAPQFEGGCIAIVSTDSAMAYLAPTAVAAVYSLPIVADAVPQSATAVVNQKSFPEGVEILVMPGGFPEAVVTGSALFAADNMGGSRNASALNAMQDSPKPSAAPGVDKKSDADAWADDLIDVHN